MPSARLVGRPLGIVASAVGLDRPGPARREPSGKARRVPSWASRPLAACLESLQGKVSQTAPVRLTISVYAYAVHADREGGGTRLPGTRAEFAASPTSGRALLAYSPELLAAPSQEKGAVAGDELDRSLILPLIKRVAPEDPGSVFVFPGADEPVVEEMAGGLLVAYVFDLPGMFRYVSAADCARLQLAPGDLHSLAVANLTRLRARPQIRQGAAAAMFVLDGDLEASLLLVDHLWEQIGPQLPGDLIAAVPARDTLAVTGSQIPGGIAALTRAVDAVWHKSPTRLLLTRSLLIRHGDSWLLPADPSARQP